MRIGIIAEGHADVAIVKGILKALTGLDMSDIQSIRPTETMDETDNAELQFSNWGLVLESCQNDTLLESFFEVLDDEALLVIHVDTAERGDVGFGVLEPQRTGHPDWKEYSQQVHANVKEKIKSLVPERFREKVAYAIAVEETDAWLIPLFESRQKRDSASHINAKEKLRVLISTLKKKSRYIDTAHNNLNYINLGAELCKGLKTARKGNESLDLFCLEIEDKWK